MNRAQKGFTLLELTVALSVWMVLSLGVFVLWQHASNTTFGLLTHQNAFENARASMDVLIMNIQMANDIVLDTDNNDVLRTLIVPGRNPQGIIHPFRFEFNVNAPPGTPMHQVLAFGQGAENAFALNISRIYMVYVPGLRIDITIQTACDYPIILHGSVDVRHKNVVVS